MEKHKKVLQEQYIQSFSFNTESAWNEECELPEGSSSIAEIQDYS